MTKFSLATVLPCLAAVAAVVAWGAETVVPSQPTELVADEATIKTVGAETKAIFTGSVTLTGTNIRIAADRIEILAEDLNDKTAGTRPQLQNFKYLLATGHVRMIQGDREATAGRAEILPREEKVVLTEEPIVVIRSPTGDKPTVIAGPVVQWTKKDGISAPRGIRATMPNLKDLGFENEKADAAGAGKAKAPETK